MNLRALQICRIPKPCEEFEIKFKFEQKCNRVQFSSEVLPAGANVVGYSWDFGDGNHSNDANPVHFYNGQGSYEFSLTVQIRHENGCCTKTIKSKVGIEECDGCEFLELNSVNITDLGVVKKFEPSLPDNPLYIYKWNFSDGTNYNSREVYKNSTGFLWGALRINYIGSGDKCCQKRYRFRTRNLTVAAA